VNAARDSILYPPVVFDIETHSVNEMYAHKPDDFHRIGATLGLGAGDVPRLHDSYDAMMSDLEYRSLLIGHNVLAFDFPALSRGFDLLAKTRAREIIDTWTLATVLDPAPVSYVNTGGVTVFPDTPERLKKYYALDNLAHQYGVPGKSHDLKQLAKEHGDPDACCQFGTIPTTNPQYRDYLAHDVLANRTVLGELLGRFTTDGKVTEYAWREMRVAAVCSQISQNGFRLDKQLTQARIDNNNAIQADRVQMLIDRYGLPTTNAAGQPAAKPTATKGGKEAILRALYDYGVDYADVPKTNKGQPSFGGEGLLELAKKYPQATPVLEAVSSIQGLRTVYQTALDNCHVDGFCHPDIYYLQASGRTSIQNPGLTVFGKRGGRHHEREVFTGDVLPEEDDDFHVLFSVDFAQIDARSVAGLSQDYNYLDKFLDGRDLHMENARTVWGPQATKQHREMAKPIGHGWNYGMGLGKLGLIAGPDIARQFIQSMERDHPRLVQWKREQADLAERYGMLDNGFGRLMKANRDRAWTQGPALMGQGAARDLAFHAILRMDDSVVRMIKAFVHDELVFSAPRSIAREVRQHAIECMTFSWCPPGATRPVDIIADATDFGLRWGALYG
jgi:DNA polymerase-1